MFALEIRFRGESPATETVFIRRPSAVVGALESAHVMIDDMAPLKYHLRVIRDVGRKFKISPMASEASTQVPYFLEGIYDGEAVLKLGPVDLHFTALDIDLLTREAEAPDRAGVRVLRQSLASSGPRFPAVVVLGNPPMAISFAPEQPVMVGRTRECAVRFDSQSISAKHARIGFESGEFWVEDLGSTNGTFLQQQQLAGRTQVGPGVPISLARTVSIVGVLSEDQLARALSAPSARAAKPVVVEPRYPMLVSSSESARPSRVALNPGTSITLGRDPSSDMWLGAPHISREHCRVEMTKAGIIRLIDESTNGTSVDNRILRRGESLELYNRSTVLDFGGSLTVAVCFSEADEQTYVATNGSAHAFTPDIGDAGSGASKTQHGHRRRGTSSWVRAPGTGVIGREELIGVRGGAVRRLFDTLSTQGRLAFSVAGVLLGVIIAVIFWLLLSGSR